jgi:hypothetical protein
MRGRAKLASYLAIGMAVAGFLLIGAAWNGAAGLDFIQGQFPYLLSGGLGGLAFIVGGMALLVIQAYRELTARRALEMAELNRQMGRVLALVEEGGPGLLTQPHERPHRHSAEEDAAELAHRDELETAVFSAVPAHIESPVVVAGRSSFHVPSCRLVVERDDLEHIPREQAEADGLNPCRICSP